MRNIIAWAIKNNPAMNILTLGLLGVGFFSLYRMQREVFPEFELEIILVTVPYPGASPSEVEDGIVQKIEEACRGIDGIKKQTAIAREGAGFLVLECRERTDVQKILDDVRAAIDRIPSFPELAEDPEIQQIVFREPAIRVGVVEAFDRTPEMDDLELELRLRAVTEQIRDEILQLPAVSQAIVVGSRDYQIDVEIPQSTLREYDLTLEDVARTIAAENLELPGGSIKTESQEILVRGREKRTVGAELETLMVSTNGGGDKIPLSKIANVKDAFVDATAVSYVNGRPGLVISIDRSKAEDLIQMAIEVREYLKKREVPGYQLLHWRDQSVDVEDRLSMLITNGSGGFILVFLVLALFLEFRLAFWVALGIPISLFGAGIVMLGFGQTLNMLTMFSFLMAVGIVVDDAIVIGENIYRHREMGKSLFQSALDGTVEVVPSIWASVMTTVIAFLPLAFVSGVMGKFIGVMPLAIISMLLISLVEASVILPCHLYHAKNPVVTVLEYALFPVKWLTDALRPIVTRLLDAFVQFVYSPLLRASLNNPLTFMAGSFGLIAISVGFVVGGFAKFEGFPKIDSPVVEATIVYPDGTPGQYTAAAVKRIEDAFWKLNEDLLAQNDGKPVYDVVHRTAGSAGVSSPGGPAEQLEGANVGRVSVELKPSTERKVSSMEIERRWREVAGSFPGAERLTFQAPQMGPPGSGIEFKILGDSDDFASLEAFAEEAKEKLSTYGGVFDVRDDSRTGNWEFQISVKERAQTLGITLERIAQTLRSAYYGAEAKRIQRGRHEVKLMVRLPEEDRESLVQFGELYVRGDDGKQYPVSEVAEVSVTRGYSEINRLNQRRAITVTADIDSSKANSREVIDDFTANWMTDKLAESPGISVSWDGQAQDTSESFASLAFGFAMAALAMYVLLSVQFRSYFQPLMILFAVPFGIIGAIFGHVIMGLDLTLFSMFGLVALTGVVVNDSIVLVDFINMHVAEGKPIKSALLDAGRIRLRPILLTSATTIAGLAPMLFERSFQAQFLIPMATSLVFGLVVTTFLCLFQVPVVYLLYAGIFMRDYPREEGDPQHVPTEEEVDEATYGGGSLVGAHGEEPGGA